MDIPLDAEVQCRDGQCGQTSQVIINPVDNTITHVVVEDSSFADARDRLVPVERVASVAKVGGTTRQAITLDCTMDELAAMEPFSTTSYIQVDMPDYAYYSGEPYVYAHPYYIPTVVPVVEEHVPAGEIAARRGMGVEATDGWIGKVDGLVIHPESGTVSHIVLEKGHLWGKKTLTLPLSAIDHVEYDTVRLKLDKKTVGSLPAIPVRRSGGWWDSEIDLVVWLFDQTDKAAEALEFLKDLRKQKAIVAIRNSAVVVRDEEGGVSVTEAKEFKARHGRLLGAVTGGLIGLVAGPVGAVVGAVGGVVAGGAAGKRIDTGLPNKYLEDVAAKLEPGTSALVALIENTSCGEISEAMEPFGGQVFRQALPDEIVARALEEVEG